MQEEIRNRPRVFISTLGLQPQVVTLALDILHRQRIEFDEICIIHTDDQPDEEREKRKFSTMRDSVKALDEEFMLMRPQEAPFGEVRRMAEYRHAPRRRPVLYRRVTITREATTEEQRLGKAEGGRLRVRDVETRLNARATFSTIYQLVREYKEQRAMIQFSVAGGRKSMSVYGLAAAQLLFEQGDALWHLVSEAEFEYNSTMHDDRERSRLIPIRFIYLSMVAPVVSQLITRPDPFDAITVQEEFLHPMDLSRKERFLSTLDHRDRQILLGVSQSLTNEQIGHRLDRPIAGKTVAHRLTEIYEIYLMYLDAPRTTIQEPGRERIRTFLAAEFGAYFDHRGERLPEPNG